MGKSGLVVWKAHQQAARLVKAGVSSKAVDQVFQNHKAVPLFMGSPFPLPRVSPSRRKLSVGYLGPEF